MTTPTAEINWLDSACLKAVSEGYAEPEDWFPATTVPKRRAVRLCHQCPLEKQCRDYAKTHRLVGVWGGKEFGKSQIRTCRRCQRLVPSTDHQCRTCAAEDGKRGRQLQLHGVTEAVSQVRGEAA